MATAPSIKDFWRKVSEANMGNVDAFLSKRTILEYLPENDLLSVELGIIRHRENIMGLDTPSFHSSTTLRYCSTNDRVVGFTISRFKSNYLTSQSDNATRSLFFDLFGIFGDSGFKISLEPRHTPCAFDKFIIAILTESFSDLRLHVSYPD